MNDLRPESVDSTKDRISQITFHQLFKEGLTEYTHVGTAGLKDAPPLPTDYSLFKDRVYEIKTDAIFTAAFNITVFTIPSVETEQQFNSLSILHLKYDDLSPTDKAWEDVTLTSQPSHERTFQLIPKKRYDSLQPSFSERRLAAVNERFGTFALATWSRPNPATATPFPKVILKTESSPEPAKPGHDVTHTLTFINQGSTAAAEVNVKEVLDADLNYVSLSTSQGVCRQKSALNIIICHLGVLPAGGQATINIVSRARNLFNKDMFGKPERSRLAINVLEVVFKQNATDFVDERGQIFSDVRTTIVNEP